MAEGDDDDKKHDPSEQSLRESAERGELPRSTELTAVVSLIAAVGAMVIASAEVTSPIQRFTYDLYDPSYRIDEGGALDLLQRGGLAIGGTVLLPLFAGAGGAIVAGLAQTRFQIATKAFETDLDRLNPINAFQKIFLSRQPLVELVKGLLHAGALGAIAGYIVWGHIQTLPRYAAVSVRDQLTMMPLLAWDLLVRSLPVLIALVSIDYGYQYYTWWRSKMRTDQEVRDDLKNQEGDPQVKAQRRRRMRELATRNTLKQLKEADVLVTNPTHYAVGLRYKHGVDPAPIVVVKGVDAVALRLRTEAFKLGIPRVEDPQLARTLFATVPRGKVVPGHLYAPVAKVLAVVYRKRRRVKAPPAAPPRRARSSARDPGTANPTSRG